MPEPWLAHHHPTRRFSSDTRLDACAACATALAREARRQPRLALCLKTQFDRVYVTAEYLDETVRTHGAFDLLLAVAGDAVREVFVTARQVLWPPARWRSLIVDEQLRRRGLPPFPRTTATRVELPLLAPDVTVAADASNVLVLHAADAAIR